jgi:hypothetical protein
MWLPSRWSTWRSARLAIAASGDLFFPGRSVARALLGIAPTGTIAELKPQQPN